MEKRSPCPYCGSSRIRLLEARITVRIVEVSEGGPWVERKYPVYRCLACGHSFDEIESEEGQAADGRALLD